MNMERRIGCVETILKFLDGVGVLGGEGWRYKKKTFFEIQFAQFCSVLSN